MSETHVREHAMIVGNRRSAEGMAWTVVDRRRMGSTRWLCERSRLPPSARLGPLPLLRPQQPRACGARHARLHVRAPPRVRRRSHRGDRQHHAQAAAGRKAPDGCRLLLLARPLDDRVLARRGPRRRGEDGQLADPGFPGHRRLHRRLRLRHLPDRDRPDQPRRAARHPRRVSAAEERRLQRAEARRGAPEPGADEPLLPQARR